MSYFLREVNEQARALRAAVEFYRDQGAALLEEAGRRAAGRPLLIAGMGSSWAAALALEAALGRGGRLAVAVEASEALYRRLPLLRDRDGPAVVLISQSGESPEIVRLVEEIRAPLIAITNAPGSTLGRKARPALPLEAGREEGVTNKTFLNSIAVGGLLARALLAPGAAALGAEVLRAGDEVAEAASAVETLLAGAREASEVVYRHLARPPGPAAAPSGDKGGGRGEPAAGSPLAAWDLIGRGSGMAAVEQGALTLRELTGRAVVPFSGGLYRHGPVYRSDSATRALLLASREEEGTLQERLAREIAGRGGRAALIADFEPGECPGGLLHVPVPRVGPGLFPIPALLPLEFLGIADGAARGFEPGLGVPKVTPTE